MYDSYAWFYACLKIETQIPNQVMSSLILKQLPKVTIVMNQGIQGQGQGIRVLRFSGQGI